VSLRLPPGCVCLLMHWQDLRLRLVPGCCARSGRGRANLRRCEILPPGCVCLFKLMHWKDLRLRLVRCALMQLTQTPGAKTTASFSPMKSANVRRPLDPSSAVSVPASHGLSLALTPPHLHHNTIRDMMAASSHVLSLIPCGKYPMGI
jgi:hypothetical protein